MAIIFSLDQEDIKIRVKVTDCVSDNPFDVSSIIDQKIIFYKPNGLRLDKEAELVEDNENSGEFFVEFQGEIPSFLDLIGMWQYAAEIQLSSTALVQTSQREVFWVT